MQRDVKIGLSLGLLLVVIVATLFFRREPERAAGPPALADAASLNQAIGERERSPYTLGEPDEFASPPAPPPSAREAAAARRARPPVIGVLASDDEDLHDRLLSERHVPVPDPVPADTATPPPAVNGAEAPAANGTRTHIIKAGDKLSLLASKYLGSSARFQEIFEANRGVLKTPSQLPVGVTIVIPPQDRPRPADNEAAAPKTPETAAPKRTNPAAAVADPAKPAKSDADSAKLEPEARKKLFRPSKRGPFASGRLPRGKFARESEPNSEALATPADPVPADAVPADTVPAVPPAEDTPPGLPKIEVDDRGDLLDPDNEAVPPPKNP